MRVLLDECLPRQLARELPEHEVRTVREVGWASTQNGALLRRAGGVFDVFVTADSNIEYQQNTATLPVAIIVLIAYTNDVDVLRLLMPQLRELLPSVEPGRVYHIGPPGPTR